MRSEWTIVQRLLFILNLFCIDATFLGIDKGSLCKGGRCELLTECPSVTKFVMSEVDICNFDNKVPIVCCPFEGTAESTTAVLSTSTTGDLSAWMTRATSIAKASAPSTFTTTGRRSTGGSISYVSASTVESAQATTKQRPTSVHYADTHFKDGTTDSISSFCKGGKCELVSECTTVGDFRKTRPDICSFQGKVPIVCCPSEGLSSSAPLVSIQPVTTTTEEPKNPSHTFPQVNVEPNPEEDIPNYEFGAIAIRKCEEYNEIACKNNFKVMRVKRQTAWSFDHVILGGINSKPKELTFMALLGYGEATTKEWDCGGTVISDRWVLSAAHCNQHNRLGEPKWIRVGELTLGSETDDASPVDLPIIERVINPDYGPEPAVYNDIALFKSQYQIIFNSYVKPICLMTYFPTISDKLTAAGWGTTEFGGMRSSTLQQVDLNYVSTKVCRDQYGRSKLLPLSIDGLTQICAGTPGKDSCTGDSGGPLFQDGSSQCLKSQVGITSFGRRCGKLPGVYTFILNYIKWIEKTVWPEELFNPSNKPPKTYDILI